MLVNGISRLAFQPICALNANQVRGFATLKEISLRLKSVKNIQKITKSMKMVSAAKYAKAERDLKGARAYGEGAKAFYNNISSGEEKTTEVLPPTKKRLLVLITSDRGLCGGVHTSIAKVARNILNTKPSDVDCKLVCIGEKSKMILARYFPNNILFTAKDIGRAPPTFEDASIAANAILNSDYEFDEGTIIFNRYKTVVSYDTTQLPIYKLEGVKSKEKLTTYDSVDDDVLVDFTQYSLAQLIYYAMKESATSEQASRMTAMDAASKNAGEMIDKLSMQFNRTRQAVITRELIEIISGASCV